jgi:uncharacterized protein YbbC (DUF1343 family)
MNLSLKLYCLIPLLLLFCASAETQYDIPVRAYVSVKTGLDIFLEDHAKEYKGKRIALVTNHSGVDRDLRQNIDLLRNKGIEIALILAPEHGIFGYEKDYDKNLFNVDNRINGIIYNLHNLNQGQLTNLLKVADTVIVDIQDLGMRCYTYVSSLKFVMNSMKGTGKELIILDRPNPLAFLGVDGPYLNPKFFSRHISSFPSTFMYDMTIGEAAEYYRGEYAKNVKLRVIQVHNYSRNMYYHETTLPWVPPSPNLPTYKSAITYSAVVLMEGVNISLGRGTPKPFEYIGAPWIEPMKFCRDLQAMDLKNFRFRPIYFSPTFSKYRNAKCGGAQIFFVGEKFSPTEVSYRLIQYLKKNYKEFKWEKYQNTYDLDFLAGTDVFRKSIDEGKSYEEYYDLVKKDILAFEKKREKYLMY